MSGKPTYEELEQKVKAFEKAETNRKQVEEELMESNENFRLIAENFQDVFWMSTPGIEKMLYVSPAYEKIWGLSCESLYESPISFIDAIHFEDRIRVLDELEKHKEGSWGPIEYRIIRPDGSICWIKDRGFPIKDKQGNLQKVTGVATDITEYKQAENDLEKSEEKYRTLFEAESDAIFMVDAETGNILDANEAAVELYGYSKEDFIRLTAMDLSAEPGDTKEAIRKSSGRASLPFRHHRKKNGTIFPVEITANYFELNEKKINISAVRDIADRKRIEKALQESEEKYRLLVESTADWVWSCDLEGLNTFSNKAIQQVLGYEVHEILNTPAFNLMHPEDRKHIQGWFQKAKEQKRGWKGNVVRWQHKDGSTKFLETSAEPIFDEDNLIGFTGIDREITERKQFEEAVKSSEARLKALSEASFEGIFLSEKGICLDQNQTAKRMFGYARAEAIGRHGEEWIAPEDREQVKNNMLSGYERPYEVTALRKDGTTFPCEIQARMIDYQGRPIRITALRDITERKRAERALRDSEEKYRQLFKTISDIIMIFDSETQEFVDVNDAALEAYGYSREEFLELKHSDITAEAEESVKSIDKTLSGEINRISLRYHKRKDGTIFPVEISTGVFKLGNRQMLCGVVRNIAERKQAEHKLRESEEKYRSLLDDVINSSEFGLFILNPDFKVVWMNRALERYLGLKKEEVIGKDKRQLILKQIKYKFEDPEGFVEKVLATYDNNTYVESFECHVLSGDKGQDRWLEHWSQPIRLGPYRGGRVELYYDITDRKQAEDTLKENEEKYRFLAENMVDIVWTIDRDFRTTYVSRSIEETLGFTVEERKQQTLEEMMTPESVQRVQMKFLEELQDDEDGVSDPDRFVTIEVEFYRKDGSTVWMENKVKPMRDLAGDIIGMHGVSRDITERKQAESALLKSREELRLLSSQIIKAQEEERRRISLELHDEMGQSLTAIEISLTEIEEVLSSDIDSNTRGRFADIHSIIQKASNQVSELSLDLRPSMLDDLGLIPTLRWYLNRIRQRRSNLNIKFEPADMDKRLDPDIETVFYRIAQESINNAIKHSEAEHMMVRLEQKQASIMLIIEDDGKGFDARKVLADNLKGRIGLLGMQERISMVKGSLSIKSSEGHGTVVLAEIPIH